MTRTMVTIAVLCLLGVLIPGHLSGAQDKPAAAPAGGDASAETAALAKAAQNPVANMISLPFQYNVNFGVDQYEMPRLRLRNLLSGDFMETHQRTQHVLNIQPVYPVNVGSLNLINRLIMPVMYQPMGSDDGEFGLGDIQYTMFLSPANAGKLIWGVGPVFVFPTATDKVLGSSKWSAGPSAVVLTMPGHWVLGALVQNIWSFAGESDRPDVCSMLLQPFINYNMKQGWYLTSSPIITANWKADSGNQWTVPVGGGVGKIFKIGNQPMNAQLGAYYNLEHPDGGAEWNLRFQLQFMFPTGKK